MFISSRYGWTVCALLCIVLMAGCSSRTESVDATLVKPEGERNPAPEFSLKDADGRTVELFDYRGKVVLLNFWATWCGPCKYEIPWFTEFEKQHSDKGFAVIGVSLDEEGWEVVKPYLERAKVNYRIVLGDDQVAMRYGGVEALPTSFLIDREGKIATVHVGLKKKRDYENDINVLLGIGTGRRRSPASFGVPAVIAGAE